MCREDVLTTCVLLEMFDQPGDAVRLETDFQFVKERDVTSTKGLLLQAGRQHALRTETKLAKRHVTVVQGEAADLNTDGLRIQVCLVRRCDVHAERARSRFRFARNGIKSREAH